MRLFEEHNNERVESHNKISKNKFIVHRFAFIVAFKSVLK